MAQNENLFELFTQRVFRIPDYQRGYAWEEKQLSELWDDLDEIISENGDLRHHYTGTIFLDKTKPQKEDEWFESKFYNIVDGQQRLTTLVILIFELLKETEKGYCEIKKDELFEIFIAKKNLQETRKIYKFRYMDTDQNNKYLLRNIFEDDKIVSEPDNQNVYSKNLKLAKKFFSEKIKELDATQKETLFGKIIHKLVFDVRIIENDLDVQAVFETMNNRGKPLTVLEKLKNRLIYLTEKKINEPADRNTLRKKINDAWGKIYSSLAKNPHRVLDEDEFLSAHLSLFKKPEDNVFSEKSAERKVFQMFCNKPEKYAEEPVNYHVIEEYIVDLSDLAPVWYDIHNSPGLVKKILLLNGSKEVRIFLAALFKNTTISENERQFTLVLLEKILFRNGVPGMWCINIESTASHKARELYTEKITICEVNDFFSGITKETINQQSVINNFRYLFSYERGNKGFHRWWGLKYFLFEYEENLKKKYDETSNKVSLDDFGDTQIEHIIPRAWSNFWKNEIEEFTETINEDKKDYVIKVLLNTLGNLTILKEKNQELQDKSWDVKKKRFSTGSYNEIEISKYDKWNYTSIQKRGEKMLKFLCEKVQDNFTFDDETTRQILFDADYIIKRIYGDHI